MVGEVKLSITRSWVQNLSLPDERSNRETSRRIGFYSVYLVSLQGVPFIQLYFHICRLTSAPPISVFFLAINAIRARLGVARHLSTTPRWGNPAKCLSQRHNK